MYVWGEGFLGMGIAIPPTKPHRTAVDQVCSYSAPLASLRKVAEGSKSFLLIGLQTQRLLHRKRKYSVPHNCNRQNEK